MRERLFRLLDAQRRHRVVWVSGPPGAGKTTLVASYLGASTACSLWYHLDSGDSDPATLFYYLVQGIGGLSMRRSARLPLLTPEYLPDLEGFGRRFMRKAFTHLPAGALLVFDNYHEIAEASAVHRILNAAFAEVPDGSSVIVISRNPPPAVFARMQVADMLVTLGWEDLSLSVEETAAIASTRVRDLRSEVVQAIHGQAGGWVTGVRLLLDRMESSEASEPLDQMDSLDAAFDYFAAEIFDDAGDEVRQVLLKTALLPRFTVAIAVAASGNERAGRILEELYRRRLFIERRPGGEPTYQYHDLFRAFLCSQVRQRFSPEESASFARESARLLLGSNLAAEAFALFAQAQDWQPAEQLFVVHAPMLIAQGRWQTLESWGKVLPSARTKCNPWLHYWLGRSKTLVDPGSARRLLEQAYASFAARDDHVGELLSATAVLDALYFEVSAFQLIPPWLERVAQLVDAHGVELSIDDDLRVHATLMSRTHLAQPGPALTRSVARVKQLLPRCDDANLVLSVANMVHYYAGHALDSEANQTAMREAHRLLQRPELSADRLALYWLAEGHAHYMFARYRKALDCFGRADVIIEEHGLVQRVLVAGAWRCQCEAASGDVRAAQATIARTECCIASDHGFISALFQWARSVVAAAAGDFEHSIELSMQAVEQNRQSGSPISYVLWLARLSYRLIAAGRIEQGLELIATRCAEPETVAYTHTGAALALVRAWAALRNGDAALCHAALRDALTLARDPRQRLRLRPFSVALEELLPLAFEQEIEPEAARALVAECSIDAPNPLLERWPWPVSIYTLGRFEVLVKQAPLQFGRKVPKRTLALLKAVIAFGGKGVPEQRLADALWPEQDGDAAHESLAAAVHRLRRLLCVEGVIVQSGNTLSLDPRRCFVDAWAFDRGLQRLEGAQTALRLYRGSFLADDLDAQWSVSLRERLRGRFVRAVLGSAEGLEADGRYEEAIDLYARGLDADDLVESFYQGLMRCYRSLGRSAEARATYRRLCRTLAANIGVEPSVESRRLFDLG